MFEGIGNQTIISNFSHARQHQIRLFSERECLEKKTR
jgi:hypothetical protein